MYADEKQNIYIDVWKVIGKKVVELIRWFNRSQLSDKNDQRIVEEVVIIKVSEYKISEWENNFGKARFTCQ